MVLAVVLSAASLKHLLILAFFIDFQRQRARWARGHAFAATDTGRIRKLTTEIKADSRAIAFAIAADHKIAAHFIAAANAAIAKDAGVVVDRDQAG